MCGRAQVRVCITCVSRPHTKSCVHTKVYVPACGSSCLESQAVCRPGTWAHLPLMSDGEVRVGGCGIWAVLGVGAGRDWDVEGRSLPLTPFTLFLDSKPPFGEGKGVSCPQGPSSARPCAGQCWPVRSPFPSGALGAWAMPSRWPSPWGRVGTQWDLERDRVVRAVASWGSGNEARSIALGAGAASESPAPALARGTRAGGGVRCSKWPTALPAPAGAPFLCQLRWGQAQGRRSAWHWGGSQAVTAILRSRLQPSAPGPVRDVCVASQAGQSLGSGTGVQHPVRLRAWPRLNLNRGHGGRAGPGPDGSKWPAFVRAPGACRGPARPPSPGPPAGPPHAARSLGLRPALAQMRCCPSCLLRH